MAENILIIPDVHYPTHDRKLFKALLEIIETTQPDEIILIGDLMDFPQPSRWTKDSRAEFEGNVYDDCKGAIKDILEPLREVYGGRIGVHEGNHDARPRLYMEKYAPAMAQTEMFNFEKLLGFEELEITKLPDFYDIAPGWITTHGHLGGIRLNQHAGLTALNAAKRIGKSIIMGHTHRAGISHYTTGLAGKVSTLTGIEVGHIMDPKQVTYLKGATGNWQQALLWLTLDGSHVSPTLCPVSAGRITIEGQVFKI